MRLIVLEKLAYTRKICVATIKSSGHHSVMSIHQRIKDRRLALGLTSHKALADKVGVSWQTVQLWEKEDGTAPSRKRIDKVAEVLKVTPTWLMHGDSQAAVIDEAHQSFGFSAKDWDDLVTWFEKKIDHEDEFKIAFTGTPTDKFHAIAQNLFERIKEKIATQQAEYIFATPKEIHLLTLYRTSTDAGRSEIIHTAETTEKVVHAPAIIRSKA